MEIDWEAEVNQIFEDQQRVVEDGWARVLGAMAAVGHVVAAAGRAIASLLESVLNTTLFISIRRHLHHQWISRDRRLHPRAYRGIVQYRKPRPMIR